MPLVGMGELPMNGIPTGDLVRTNSQGKVVIPEYCRGPVEIGMEVGVEATGEAVVVIDPDPPEEWSTRIIDDRDRVTIPSPIRRKWGEGRYYRPELGEGGDVIRLYPVIIRDVCDEVSPNVV